MAIYAPLEVIPSFLVCLFESKINDVIGTLPRPQGLLVPIGHCQVVPMLSDKARLSPSGVESGGGGTPNSSDGDDRRIFGGLKRSILGLFWVGSSSKHFFLARVKKGFFWGYSKQSEGSW